MSDRIEELTPQSSFLHHLSPEEKIKIFRECQAQFAWYKNSMIEKTKEWVRKRGEMKSY